MKILDDEKCVHLNEYSTSYSAHNDAASNKGRSLWKATEDKGRSMTSSSVHYMKSDADKFRVNPPFLNRQHLSEMKDNYRGQAQTDSLHVDLKPDELCSLQSAKNRTDGPSIPLHGRGYHRLLDPYMTTTMEHHKPFTKEEQLGVANKDCITLYTESGAFTKAWGFGPKHKEISAPFRSRRKQCVEDKLKFKTEAVGGTRCKMDRWVRSSFNAETSSQFRPPLTMSDVAHRQNVFEGVHDQTRFEDLPNQIAPSTYRPESHHYGSGIPVYAIVDQTDHKRTIVHKPCDKPLYIVSRNC